MAHDPQTKARALAMLITGDSPRHVAEQLGLPRTTVRRWQAEARPHLGQVMTPDDRAVLRDIAESMRRAGFVF